MKRFFDLLLALILSFFLIWLIVLVAIVVRLSSKGPVLYWSSRIGVDNQLFKMPKFRTMRAQTPVLATHLMTNPNTFLSPVGAFLRRFSLDELPQLFSILKGEMSFVGPRPESPDYTKLYTEKQLAILELRPGITDFASIEFSDLGSILTGDDPDKIYFEKVWDRKMKLRLKYVNERSFWIDIKLIFQTLSAIFVRK